MNGISTAGSRVTRTVILAAMMLFTIVPLLSMLSTALQPPGSVPTGIAIPAHPHWHNFAAAWNAADFLVLLKSSTLIVLGVVPAAVALATLAGYGLSQARVPGRKALYALFVAGLTLPAESLISPLYFQLRGMGLLDTRWALILPLTGLYMPFGVYWMRASFLGIPPQLAQAAEIDGASSWQQFRRIQLPLAAPAWSTLAILYFIWTWNQFLLPLVLVSDPTRRTMAGALGAFEGEFSTNIVLLTAGSLIIITPSLLVFLIFQRRFVTALLQGAIK